MAQDTSSKKTTTEVTEFKTRNIKLPLDVHSQLIIENSQANLGRGKEEKLNTEQEIVELIKEAIAARVASRI